MTEPQTNKKIVFLTFMIIVIISAVAGYFITNWAFSGDVEKTDSVSVKQDSSKVKSIEDDENFGIEVADPTKASEEIKDQKTLDFITDLAKHDDKHITTYGDPNAPLTIIEFSDFSCPMCAKFHKESYAVIDKLVDAGKVRVKYMPFAVFKNDGSDIAAAGSIAAAKQGKFREFVHTAFGKATTSGHEQYTKESVIELAKEVGVPNIEEFKKGLDDTKVYDELDQNVLLYSSWGISGTPSTIIGKAFISGAVPEDYVAATVVDQLRKAVK